MSTNLLQPKIPLWQPSVGKPTPSRLIWLKALMDGNKEAIGVELARCSRDPWHLLTNWVLTENTHFTSSTPFERFPDKAHLYYLTRLWQRERFLIVPKSRQMTVTWLFCALYLWKAMFRPSRFIFIQSKKEEDSDEVLERCFTIYQRLPLFMRNWAPLSGGKKTYCHMRLKRSRSRLWAIPEGPEHFRSYTPSDVFSDETVYQENVEKMLTAAVPALGQKGCMTMVSSAGPGIFALLALDDFTAT